MLGGETILTSYLRKDVDMMLENILLAPMLLSVHADGK